MAGERRVFFARINRREQGQGALSMNEFRDDMQVLAESHRTTYAEPSTATRMARTWFAADMTTTPDGDFLLGTLGFSEQQEQREFDTESWSWIKGATAQTDAGSEQTVVPFAVDLREGHRWVAFATSTRLRHDNFRRGLELVLREAVREAGLLSAEWDVDLVTSKASVRNWIQEHPDVFEMVRTVQFTNPGRDLDEDRRQMRALAANRKTEVFRARYGQTLDSASEEFEEKLNGTETGDLKIALSARGSEGVKEETYKSWESPDQALIEAFETLHDGMEMALQALREYVSGRGDAERTRDTGG